MTTSSRKFFAVIIERNGQELARDVLDTDRAADARRTFMQSVRQHEFDPSTSRSIAESRNLRVVAVRTPDCSNATGS